MVFISSGLVLLLGFALNAIDTAPDKCTPFNCQLPKCFCASTEGPESISKDQLPQIVVMTFDDAINELNFEYYKTLLQSTRRNPNGCPISATFYVSDEWTNYDMVKSLYLQGHEIASHSITHRTPQDWWSSASYKEWIYEMDGQRNNIAKGASVPKSEVRGVRIPYLQLGGNTQYRMLTDKGFQYDASCMSGPYSASDRRLPAWPYTLDFPPELEFCDSNERSSANFSGFWEIPLNRWLGLDGKACPMADACTTQDLKDKQGVLKYLETNFKRHYLENRAPFGIGLHATWFKEEYRLDAVDDFIEYLSRLDDVWIVTVYQMIEWMRNPTPNSELKSFEPWQSCRKPIKLLRPRNSESISEDRDLQNTGGRGSGSSREEPGGILGASNDLKELDGRPQKIPNKVTKTEERNPSDIQVNLPSKKDPTIDEEDKELTEKQPGNNGQPNQPVWNPELKDESQNVGRKNGPVLISKPGSSPTERRPNSRSSNGHSSSSGPSPLSLPHGIFTTNVILVVLCIIDSLFII